MPSQPSPKVVLFDIGGVCVLSPFQAILDYERKHGIPTDWINYAIRYSSPNGHWQRLERGELKLGTDFFAGFISDLHNRDAWRDFHEHFMNEKNKLKSVANPTQLGDHVSLKAEQADSNPTDQDKGAQGIDSNPSTITASQDKPRPSLSKLAKDTTIGDPVSIESEDVAESVTGGNPKNGPSPGGTGPEIRKSSGRADLPDIPSIDGEELFWSMMSSSREPDPYIFPALERLLKQKPRPIVGALSNTVIYPPEHPWSKQNRGKAGIASTSSALFADPNSVFDVYVASAEVGMRKPSKDIYESTIKRLNEFDKQKGGNGVTGADIVFLDDIGENLKSAKEVGMRTIKVQLGKTWRAVKELEGILSVDLMDEKTRRSKL